MSSEASYDINNQDTFNMLNILIISRNFPYVIGVNSLFKLLADKKNIKLFFSLPSEADNEKYANIIFRDSIVSVNIYKNKELFFKSKDKLDAIKVTVHIPFILKQDNLSVIMSKIEKILVIANSDYQSLINKEIYKAIGSKDYLQLSFMESKIMLLIGKGYNMVGISNLLNRSEKTINAHCRNAIRKMGMTNRVEFYKYATFIATRSNKERNTLCL